MNFEVSCTTILGISQQLIDQLGDPNDAVKSDPELSKYEYWIEPKPYSDEFYNLLEVTKKTAGFRTKFIPLFTKSEIENSEYFLVQPNKFLHFTISASDKFDQYINSLSYFNQEDDYPIKIPEKYVSSSFKLAQNSFGFLDGMGGYFFDKATISRIFEKKCTGWGTSPVYDLKEQLRSNYLALSPDFVLPPAEVDITRRSASYFDSRILEIAGCLSFEEQSLSGAKDINWTREHNSFHVGNIIVTRKFIEIYEDNKLKGLEFQPVLIKGSKLYDEYIMLFSELEAKLKEYNIHNELIFE